MSQESYKEMLFSRQYVMAEQSCNNFSTLNTFRFDKYFLYVHPLLDVTFSETEHSKALLLGYAINPHVPSMTNQDVVDSICTQALSVEDVAKSLYPLSGRFALYIFIKGDLFVFHDACGYRTVVYTNTPNGMLFGSDEQIMQQHTPLIKGENDEQFNNSILPSLFENWIPAGTSLYRDVNKLIANHYLDFQTYTQKRFYPTAKLEYADNFLEVVGITKKIIKGSLEALKLRKKKLAFAITAGRDSRFLLSFLDKDINDIYFYTIGYEKFAGNKFDIEVPSKILKSLNGRHNIIDANNTTNSDFSEMYMKNTMMSHLDLSDIAYAMTEKYPSEYINLKGVASEIVSCYYYSKGKKLLNDGFVKSMEEVLELAHVTDMLEVPFAKKALTEWYDEIFDLQEKFHFSPYDMFFWEQRMSCWQAQSQLEWDMVHESFIPLNNRELIFSILNMNKKYRIKQNNLLYTHIINEQAPYLLKTPYDNEKKGIRLLIRLVKRKLYKWIK